MTKEREKTKRFPMEEDDVTAMEWSSGQLGTAVLNNYSNYYY
jgi:hypothetical protein